jgi:anti-sigma regulatory factor (Ser/Thr protein kinase)
MSSVLLPTGWVKSAQPGLDLNWSWESHSRPEEAGPVIECVAAAMSREGYPEHDIFEMRQALREAIANAIHHGNEDDPAKLVRVECDVDAERVLVDVRDEGPGFDPRAEGQGLALMRLYLSWVRPGEPGGVTLCKYRSLL